MINKLDNDTKNGGAIAPPFSIWAEVLQTRNYDKFVSLIDKTSFDELTQADVKVIAKLVVVFAYKKLAQRILGALESFCIDDFDCAYLTFAIKARFHTEFSEDNVVLLNIWLSRVDSSKQSMLLNLLGLHLAWTNNLDEAIKTFSEARRLDLSNVDSIVNLNIVFEKQKDYISVFENYERHQEMLINNFPVKESLIRALIALGKPITALRLIRTMQENKELDETQKRTLHRYTNICKIELRSPDIDGDLIVMRQYFETYNSHIPAMWDHSLDLLKLGNTFRGFRLYDYFRNRGLSPAVKLGSVPANVRKFSGGADCKIILVEEQGVGDVIYFLMYLPEFIKIYRPRKIILLQEARLTNALRRHIDIIALSGTDIEFVDRYSDISDVKEYKYLHVGSLPRFSLQKNSTTVFKDILTPQSPKYDVGILWRGGVNRQMQLTRSLKLNRLLETLKFSNLDICALQYSVTETERTLLTENKMYFPQYDCFSRLDLWFADILSCRKIISIDNSAIHVAGAAGIETHLMSRTPLEFRWGRGLNSIYQKMHFSVFVEDEESCYKRISDIIT